MSARGDVRAVLTEAERDGWQIEPRGHRGGYKLRHPKADRLVFVSNDPDGHMALKRIRADLRRAIPEGRA